ncbi:type IV toxin-antitoxin system AbiEi family antitoxin domain-containing protein [Corynebacterium glutamicum]|uniref:type IV toxin-antitoxin system AbiEi family antitoxin domain-containing protein n=1 Tax=Corynebacterium glutamicum TaxID=1718 RepID=UPI0009596939|nr:type IV toxin-antitoxin system AbiEi family antitoxin domain-containing protein [Corynebacterium glutamicum]OKX79774.1 hypothetical protein AUO95_11245 [Corynebacterium glutamicum]
MKQVEVLEALESAASDQWGIITTSQAQREGITRLQLGRLADKGVLTRVRRGMYLLPSSQYGPLTDIRVAWVSLDVGQFPDERWAEEDKIVVSHESAALIHQLGDLIPKKLTFSSTSRKQTSQDDIYIYNNRDISSQDVSNVGGLPVTSVILTVTDLAKKKIEFSYLASIVVDALRKENVRLKDIAESLNEVSLSYGFSSGLQLVQACQEEAEADEDREEKAERYLSTWNWPSIQQFSGLAASNVSSLADPLRTYANALGVGGAAGIADRLAKIANAEGTLSFAEHVARYNGGLEPTTVAARLAEIANAEGTLSFAEHVARYNGGLEPTAAAARLAEIAGAMDITSAIGAAILAEHQAKIADFGSSSSINQPKNRLKNSDPDPSGESLSSPPDPVQKQPEVVEGGNNKKEHRE